MKRTVVVICVIAVVFLLVQTKTSTGLYEVTEVYDGDTIAVRMAGRTEKVRLIGVDTPETKDPRKPVQCYGPEASAYSHANLTNTKVRLVSDPLSTNRDRYDRLLRYVYLQDGTFFNKQLLQTGNARAYTGFAFSKSADFLAVESESSRTKQGLWAVCS